MVPLENPRARAAQCLDCHFGSAGPGQFVNHRIMAAGHPRIAFEVDLFSTLTQHHDEDLKRLLGFCHRTFCDTDLLYFVHFLRDWYRQHDSLETAFLVGHTQRERLINFHQRFFSLPDAPARTRKHVATPARKSACKRVNMYLRWLVRRDEHGVDFGLWTRLSPADLIMPIDVHVERQARPLGLLTRRLVDWQAAEELTANLRLLDPTDPVKYDFALFGAGVDK